MSLRPLLAAAGLSIASLATASDTHPFRSSGLYTCPELCSITGSQAGNWTRFTSANDLLWCNDSKDGTMVLSLPLSVPMSTNGDHFIFQACLVSASEPATDAPLPDSHPVRRRVLLPRAANTTSFNSTSARHVDEDIAFVESSERASTANFGQDISAAVRELQTRFMAMPETNANATSLFARQGDAAVGVYVGAYVNKKTIADTLIQKMLDSISSSSSLPQTAALQLCGGNRTRTTTAGIAIDGRGKADSVVSVHGMVKKWSEGSCADHLHGGAHTEKMGIDYLPDKEEEVPSGPRTNTTDTTPHTFNATAMDIMRRDASGPCKVYYTQDNDNCYDIAKAHGLDSIWNIEFYNTKTWGWTGCQNFWSHMNICVSPGDPPLPAPVPNAACGPQKPGTQPPPPGTNLVDMNPCPLNACCNIWGSCGTTAEFCTVAPGPNGNPGTSQPGKNSCISNCGMDIVNNGAGPASPISLAYFEAWNYKRNCLHMDVDQISKSMSHIHFAFVNVGENFALSVSPEVQEQFERFKRMSGQHRVASFGGWDASTKPTSYWIFRQGVNAAHREVLASNMANFVMSNGLDGVDIDWEYPGAQDIQDIPADDPFNGNEYLEFLKLLRSKLPGDKTVSIAAPASFWYLKNFPIGEISKVVDYIVYMTYDLHGQWDYKNKWSQPGCNDVSCLRSHVNMTETVNALSMITKAGVASNKIVIGVSSYGRSFQMTQAGCSGPMCGFTGPASTAEKGRCTDTHGYISNAEIEEIKNTGRVNQHFTDDSESQIMVYDDTHWVAYMDDANKAARKTKWAQLNFAGSTDWAVDLATFTPGDSNGKCWLSKTCQSPGAIDTRVNPKERWDDLCTEGALDDAMAAWKADRSGHFSERVSNFLHGPPDMFCDSLSHNNNCIGTRQCYVTNETGPAASFILNGFTALSEFLVSTYDATVDVQTTMESKSNLEAFVNTFAPKKQMAIPLEIILDLVSFGLTMATGPFFNNFLRNTAWASVNQAGKDLHDNIKDSTRAIIGTSITLAKDIKPPPPATDSDLDAQLQAIVAHFKTILTATQQKLFDGSDDSINILRNLMKDGKLMGNPPVRMLDMEGRITSIFYAMLIPYLWRQRGYHPVMLDTGLKCGDTTKITHVDYNHGYICLLGNRYHIVEAHGRAIDYPLGRNGVANANDFAEMPGYNQLRNPASFGGYSTEDLGLSILNRRNIGWKNPSDVGWPSLLDGNSFNSLYAWLDDKSSAQAPGLIDIPICSVDEAVRNWIGTRNTYYSWPCNRP